MYFFQRGAIVMPELYSVEPLMHFLIIISLQSSLSISKGRRHFQLNQNLSFPFATFEFSFCRTEWNAFTAEEALNGCTSSHYSSRQSLSLLLFLVRVRNPLELAASASAFGVVNHQCARVPPKKRKTQAALLNDVPSITLIIHFRVLNIQSRCGFLKCGNVNIIIIS